MTAARILPDTAEYSGTRDSRVAARPVRAGSFVRCMSCQDVITFVPGGSRQQVTCSVYEHGELQFVELYHPDCYAEAGQPHGELDD